MRTEGNHLLLEYWGCDAGVLDDLTRIEHLMIAATQATGAKIVETIFRPYHPQGVSGVVVIEESHMSIHTWPEAGYAAVDFFTCGDCDPRKAHEVLAPGLGVQRQEMMLVERGLPELPSMRVAEK
jgi:S-adenosylmethionine decarboxylase